MQSLPRERVNRVAQELLHTYKSFKQESFCFPFTINLSKAIYLTKTSRSGLKCSGRINHHSDASFSSCASFRWIVFWKTSFPIWTKYFASDRNLSFLLWRDCYCQTFCLSSLYFIVLL